MARNQFHRLSRNNAGTCLGVWGPRVRIPPSRPLPYFLTSSPPHFLTSRNIPPVSSASHLRLQICRLPASEDLPLPTYMTEGSVGMDLYAAVDADVVLPAGEVALVPT